MRVQKNFVFLMLVSLVVVTGCQTGVPGSGVSKTETRVVAPFDSVSFSGSGGVEIKVGPVQSVELTVDDNLLPLVTTAVENGRLKIDRDENWSSSLGLQVVITVPELTAFKGFGSVDASISGIDSEQFDGSISGSGSIIASGTVKASKSSIAGSGQIDFSKLVAESTSAVISGSGTIAVYGSKSATAKVSGSGEINVYGEPENINQSILGSGQVNRR